MQKSKRVAASAGLLLAATVSLVWATQPGEASLVPRAYFATHFGGTTELHKNANFFYGMRLDRDSTFDASLLNLPPVMQLAFDRYGMTAASLYGMPFARRQVALQQAEGEAVASTSYTVIDWTLLALGVVGIGYTISEVVNQKDTSDPARGGSAAGGGGGAAGGGSTGGGTAGGGTGGGGTATGGFAEARGSTLFDHPHDSSSEAVEEYQKWLDGGTGQMGDLQPH